MKIALKTLKIIGIFFLSFIGLFMGYIIISLILSWITVSQEPDTKPKISIYIATNGMHTDIVVPIRSDQIDWSKEIKFTDTASKDSTYNYIGFGWGDKEFYMNTPEWSDLSLNLALQAALGLNASAIHTTYYKTVSESHDCKRIDISKEQYSRLVQYIQNSFKRDDNGNVIFIPTNLTYGNSDSFYEATGHFSAIYTCNSWANAALKSSGQKACLWTPFAFGIFYHYR